MSLGTMEQRTEGMKRQAAELIEQAYNRGFKAGYDKAFATLNENWQLVTSEAEEKGRNEAWEAAHKLVSMEYGECNEVLGDGVLTIETNEEIFTRCTASEAIEKIRTYKDQKKQEEDKEIKVGDEVERKTVPGKLIVHSISKFYANCIASDGGQWTLKFEDIKRTGRTFPQIAEVLKKLQEGE